MGAGSVRRRRATSPSPRSGPRRCSSRRSASRPTWPSPCSPSQPSTGRRLADRPAACSRGMLVLCRPDLVVVAALLVLLCGRRGLRAAAAMLAICLPWATFAWLHLGIPRPGHLGVQVRRVRVRPGACRALRPRAGRDRAVAPPGAGRRAGGPGMAPAPGRPLLGGWGGPARRRPLGTGNVWIYHWHSRPGDRSAHHAGLPRSRPVARPRRLAVVGARADDPGRRRGVGGLPRPARCRPGPRAGLDQLGHRGPVPRSRHHHPDGGRRAESRRGRDARVLLPMRRGRRAVRSRLPARGTRSPAPDDARAGPGGAGPQLPPPRSTRPGARDLAGDVGPRFPRAGRTRLPARRVLAEPVRSPEHRLAPRRRRTGR